MQIVEPVERENCDSGDYPEGTRERAFKNQSCNRAAGCQIGGWTAPQKSPERPFRSTTTRVATVLVPNLMPYPQRGKLWLAPAGATAVQIRWDGDLIASPTLAPGWQRVELDLPTWTVGEHELSFDTGETRAPATPGAPLISVGALDLEFAPGNRARYGD